MASYQDAWRNAMRMMLAAFFILLVHIVLLPHADAQTKVLGAAMLDNTVDSLPLGRYAILQKDPEGKITPDSIRASNGAVLSGKLSKRDNVFLGYDGVPVWISVKLVNRSMQDHWIIDLGRRAEGRIGSIKSVRAFELKVRADGGVDLRELEKMQSSGVYAINMQKDEQKLLLLNIRAGAGLPSALPLTLYHEKAYIDHIQSRTGILTFYSLLLGAFGFYFITHAIAQGRKPEIVLGAYFLYAGIIWICYDYIGSMMGAGLSGYFMLFIMLGYTILSIYSTKAFCGVEYGSFTEKYILYGLAWLNVAAIALAAILPVGGGATHISLLYGTPAFTLLVLTMMCFAQTRSGQIAGYHYFLSWVFPLVGFSVSALTSCSLLPQNGFLLNAFWISLPFQGVLVALALYNRPQEFNLRDHAPAEDNLKLNRLKETKDTADHSRLLKVIEKEREMLADFRAKEAARSEEMRKAKEAADEANRAKSAFLAVVSHEIRTPMTGVMGMVRLLLDSNITKQQRDYVLTIQESSEAMLALLNDILDFEKIQRGKIDLENISFDLHRLIHGIINLMSGHAAEKQIALAARIDDDLPKFVKGDPTRLRQVLLNLLGNAIKFTDRGNVTLFVRTINTTEHSDIKNADRYTIYFAVQDTGIGIPAEAQKNLFNPFSQASSSISRKFGGSGLGLAISKGLIERMGSSININSKEGEGSTFFFTLEMEKGLSAPIDQSRIPEAPHRPAKPAQPIKILVVDDNSVTRKVICGFLEPDGHGISSASSAEDALKRIYSDAFDLILMDIELVGMRGNEATRLLRDYGDPVKASLPVIAMTGNTSREDMERYLADGMTGFIAKPIDPEKLREIVNDVAAKTYEREIRAPGQDIRIPVQPDPFAGEPVKPYEPEVDLHGVFNPDMLQSLKDTIGASSLSDLLHDLIVKTEEILAAMSLAAEQNDLASLAARAHELKGMAGNFGLVEISSLAAQAEKKAKTAETDGLDTLIQTLPDANLRAQAALKSWVSH